MLRSSGFINTLAAFGHLASSSPTQSYTATDVFQQGVLEGPSIGDFISSAQGFDGPKVRPINNTAYDWWYFDVVSKDLKSNTGITFLSAPHSGFVSSNRASDDMLFVSFSLSTAEFPDYGFVANATEATVLGICVTTVDIPELNTTGSITFKSIAPPHYPTGPVMAGLSMEVSPGVGWANAIPAAEAEVYYKINDTEVKFTGYGYHDKNWGVEPFIDHVDSWYWGHGTVGPYNVVWFDVLHTSGSEHVSAYVAKDGEIVTAKASGLTIRPTGNFTFPPSRGDLPPGFRMEIDMEEGILDIDIVNTQFSISHFDFYHRWIGSLTGRIRGQEEVFTGQGLYEQYALVQRH
ncbi:hypothetical protein QQX98_005101 [Neonectria punicea]|uniref:AttH domain-containing protein n=1 Tax=Neonectria punicea TaxID=979145 RepID=A0ABR1H6H0_9HYPO